LGTRPTDAVVADGRHGWGPSRRWRGTQDGHRGR
jgi:hypothetical protein